MLNIKCICPPWVEVIKPADTGAFLQSFFTRVARAGLRAIWLCKRHQGLLEQGMGWLHSRDRQSSKVAFFIATAKSASENSVGVPGESFNQSTYSHPQKTHSKTFSCLAMSLIWQELFLVGLNTWNGGVCSPRPGRKLPCPVSCMFTIPSLERLRKLKAEKSLKTCRSFLWKVLTNGLQRADSLLHSKNCFFYQ